MNNGQREGRMFRYTGGRLGQPGGPMSLERILLFDINRVLSFDVNRILFFDLNRILTWDIGRAVQRPIPPVLLQGLAGWFLAAILVDVTDMRQYPGLTLMAAMAAAFVLPELVRRLRATR
jgi:hypothetical protein